MMQVAARLRHAAGTRRCSRRYLDMDRLREQDAEKRPGSEAVEMTSCGKIGGPICPQDLNNAGRCPQYHSPGGVGMEPQRKEEEEEEEKRRAPRPLPQRRPKSIVRKILDTTVNRKEEQARQTERHPTCPISFHRCERNLMLSAAITFSAGARSKLLPRGIRRC